jgi:uncharacterized protein YceH (UPF0502 family)
MDIQLNEIEARVLGCLIEKHLATPEYYPLTLNSLTAACNQKSNRNPVMTLQDTDVARAIDSLRTHHLGCEAHIAGSRVPKYEHRIAEKWELLKKEISLLGALLLRGPQTVGELRTRTARVYSFQDLQEVEESLRNLAGHAKGPFVLEMPRLPGHKENRFTHLFCGEPDLQDFEVNLPPEAATLRVRAENERISALEEEVETLRNRISDLQTRFEDFKRQFD